MSSEKPRQNTGIEPIDLLPPDEVLFGRSETMKEVRQRAAKLAGSNVPVLLYGQRGTGKEVLARWIHGRSPWCDRHFVKVNCAAIPGTLIESELFGYEKGAFTGAYSSKPGRVELAHNGTLFLDEITNLDLASQSRLLQFLQDGRFSRIGADAERAVETRLICATNEDLEHEIEKGRFRADLYYRINVVRVKLPRLRDRREDIPLLAEYFLNQFQEQFAKKADPLTKELMQYLQRLDWPGNIRELSNCIARHVVIGPDAKITQEPAPKRRSAVSGNYLAAGAVPLKQIAREAIRDKERDFILGALQANQWNRRKTAEDLKISYRALIYKIRNADLISKRKRSTESRRVNAADASGFSAD